MTDDENVRQIVERLVSLHGEGGVCPSASDWRAIFALRGAGAIHILNLLKYKPQVATSDGTIAGAAAYARYAAGVGAAFNRAGGERIFFGRVGHMFALGPSADWDAAVLTRYPSADALAQMWLDPELVVAHESRVDGVERSQVLVFGG